MLCPAIAPARTNSGGSGGAIEGTVLDPSGLAIPGAEVTIVNRLAGFHATAETGPGGAFQLQNIPPNPYHLEVSAPGFATWHQDVSLRSTVPLRLKVSLRLAAEATTLVVEGGQAQLEEVSYAHHDVGQAAFSKLPVRSAGASLSDLITLASPGVVADSNGFFHPLGDHAQTTFSIDGQPISDQQNKQFSAELPLNAIQSMELITGAASAEFGDKTSLVVTAVTRSGLGLGRTPHGDVSASYGSFGTLAEETAVGLGSSRTGNFLAANALRSGRFLDTPEFRPFHAAGNNYTLFDRFDYQPGGKNSYHVNFFHARNWFQVPDTYNQRWNGQDQRQKVLTLNLAPSLQHVFSPNALLSLNPFWRRDQVDYYPSRDPFADTPATLSQDRHLANWGAKSELSYLRGRHNVKTGLQWMQTRLQERFRLGVTDPALGAESGLAPYDLTRGGRPFLFDRNANIDQFAAFAQDAITLGKLTLNAGLRVDRYAGLSQATGVQPRLGVAYLLKPLHTVLRAAYSRTFETPYNENLILASATGEGGLATNVFGAYASRPIQPGRRNQYNAGLQQSLGKWLQLDADYFWKYTRNAFDFGTLFNTPIAFPISWHKSNIDGVSVRVSTLNVHGFQAYTTLGHTRARFFGPSNGGLIFNSPLDTAVFRIDHDQAFEQTTHLRYQRPNHGPWMAFTWRYDSGAVAGAVSGLDDALALAAAEQAAIGFYCAGRQATLTDGIQACPGGMFGAVRLRIPAPGTASADHNPPRLTPRHLFDVAVGSDNLLHKEHVRTTLKLMVTNLANNVALYNFRSTFSGTHFMAPRAYSVQIGLVF
ncbi:MAG: TonB-dependent receptor [Acidobacteria bacterium]|nr:TonB-dependent receptor [Acidobacteriota bacterium]